MEIIRKTYLLKEFEKRDKKGLLQPKKHCIYDLL